MSPTDDEIRLLRDLYAEARDAAGSAYRRHGALNKIADLMVWNWFDGGDGGLPGILDEVLRLRAENERLRSVDPEREKRIEDWRGQMQLAVGDLIKETIAIDKAPSSGNGALDAQALHDADGHVDYLLEKAVALMRSAPTSQRDALVEGHWAEVLRCHDGCGRRLEA